MPTNATTRDPATPATPERLVPLREVCERTDFDRGTIRRLEQRGQFPPGRVKGDRRKFWLESELVAWMRGDQ